MAHDLSIKLPDGRTLSYTLYGATLKSDRPTLFYFHGFPGTHAEGQPVYEAASLRGINVIGVTRPGFGDSTQQPGRRLLSLPPDVLHLADHLGVQRFAILGISGGGPYALACLSALPSDRLRSVAVVSGMWPTSFGTAGMMPQLRILYFLARWVPGFVRWMVGLEMTGPAQDTEHPERLDKLMAKGFERWPVEDREVIYANDGSLFKALCQSSREALKHGTGAFAVEANIFGSPWDLQLEKVPDDGRLVIWHGGKDANVPLAMADQAAKLMPKVDYRRFDDEGHLSLVMKRMDGILDELIKRYDA